MTIVDEEHGGDVGGVEVGDVRDDDVDIVVVGKGNNSMASSVLTERTHKSKHDRTASGKTNTTTTTTMSSATTSTESPLSNTDNTTTSAKANTLNACSGNRKIFWLLVIVLPLLHVWTESPEYFSDQLSAVVEMKPKQSPSSSMTTKTTTTAAAAATKIISNDREDGNGPEEEKLEEEEDEDDMTEMMAKMLTNKPKKTRTTTTTKSGSTKKPREAIVWIVDDILTEDCHVPRIRHLVESAKTSTRDVWILHPHNLMVQYHNNQIKYFKNINKKKKEKEKRKKDKDKDKDNNTTAAANNNSTSTEDTTVRRLTTSTTMDDLKTIDFHTKEFYQARKIMASINGIRLATADSDVVKSILSSSSADAKITSSSSSSSSSSYSDYNISAIPFLNDIGSQHLSSSSTSTVSSSFQFDTTLQSYAFFKLIIDHEYDYGWYVHQDSFYTGNWDTFFDKYTSTDDENGDNNNNNNDYEIDLLQTTTVNNPISSSSSSTSSSSSWKIARVSNQLARHIYAESNQRIIKEEQQKQKQQKEGKGENEVEKAIITKSKKISEFQFFLHFHNYHSKYVIDHMNVFDVSSSAVDNYPSLIQYSKKKLFYHPISCQLILKNNKSSSSSSATMMMMTNNKENGVGEQQQQQQQMSFMRKLIDQHYTFTENYPFSEQTDVLMKKGIRTSFPPMVPTGGGIGINNDGRQPPRREAIIWSTTIVTECEEARLRHLVETAGLNRDVYVMYAHDTNTNGNNDEKLTAMIQRSDEIIASIPNLYSFSRNDILLEPFDSSSTGSSRSTTFSAILHLTTSTTTTTTTSSNMKQQRRRYDFIWHIENDIFFTGNWYTLFDGLMENKKKMKQIRNTDEYEFDDDDDDFINDDIDKDDETNTNSYYHYYKYDDDVLTNRAIYRDRNHEWWKGFSGHMCYIDNNMQSCPKYFSGYSTSWNIIRFSYRYVYAIYNELYEGWVRGHSDSLIIPYAVSRNFTWNELSKSTYIGRIESGGWGEWKDSKYHTLERLVDKSSSSSSSTTSSTTSSGTIIKALPNRIYHPVNCDAYNNNNENPKLTIKRLIEQHAAAPYPLHNNNNNDDDGDDGKNIDNDVETANQYGQYVPEDGNNDVDEQVDGGNNDDNNQEHRRPREAIVWITDAVLECDNYRLQHLVETSKTNQRDVWVIPGTFVMSAYKDYNDKEFVTSRTNIAKMNGLRVFSGRKEKSSSSSSSSPASRRKTILNSIPVPKDSTKSIKEALDPINGEYDVTKQLDWFLELLVLHDYDYAWYIDHDNFFTGDWGQFFDDLLMKQQQQTNDDSNVDGSNDEYDLLTMEDGSWSLARISYRLGKKIWSEHKKSKIDNDDGSITTTTTTTTTTPPITDLTTLLDMNNKSKYKYGAFIGINGMKAPLASRTTKVLQNGDNYESSKLYHPLSCSVYETNVNEMKELVHGQYDVTSNFPYSEDTTRKDIRTVFPPVSPYEPNGKEAIFWTTTVVNECEASRLRHIVETSNRDVYVMHSHYKYGSEYPAVKRSKRLIESIPGLYSISQYPYMTEPFDTSVSGSSKSSTLRAMVSKKYSYGWEIENDNFFTGNWSTFFDKAAEDDADVLNTLVISSRDKNDKWWKGYAGHMCYIDGKWCGDISIYNFAWPAIRLSYKFAYAFLTEMDEGWVSGHHEAVVPSYIIKRMPSFTYNIIDDSIFGHVGLGGWGDMKDHNNQDLIRAAMGNNGKGTGTVQSNHLYHPVKCASYSNNKTRMELLLQNEAGYYRHN